MGKRETEYPHTISFRVTDEAWLGIQSEIQGSTLTPHEWCRQAALDRLTSEHGLSKSDRILDYLDSRWCRRNYLGRLFADKVWLPATPTALFEAIHSRLYQVVSAFEEAIK